MKKIILVLLLAIGYSYAQPVGDLVTYQKQYMKSATSTKDTTLATTWAFYKFTIAPTESDSVI